MNALVFATYDVTCEEWAEFRTKASMPEVDIAPYILVYSGAHSEFEEETKDIASPIKSELKSTTYREIKDLFATLAEPNSFDIHTDFFLLLDDQSPKERKVVITQKTVLHLHSDGTFISPRARAAGEKSTKTVVKWKRHRVPYEETGTFVALLVAEGGPEFEPYLEEERREEFVEES